MVWIPLQGCPTHKSQTWTGDPSDPSNRRRVARLVENEREETHPPHEAPTFFGVLLSIALLSTVLRRRSLHDFMEAVTRSYASGKRAEPLFGVDWTELWDRPLHEVRERFAIDATNVTGEGILAAA